MAHIMGLTYTASDSLFAVDETGGGHVYEQSIPLQRGVIAMTGIGRVVRCW